MLIKWTAIPGYKNELWFDALKTLFDTKTRFIKDIAKKNNRSYEYIIGDKVSEFLQLMSKYIDFETVIKHLLENDKNATFQYSKSWFLELFVSKSDQEFLYRSAKKLLSNENQTMIDVIFDQYQAGFKGSSYYNCGLCGKFLGEIRSDNGLIFCM